jgi:phage terminase large subunit-like protein
MPAAAAKKTRTLPPIDLTDAQQAAIVAAIKYREKFQQIDQLYPDNGPRRRALYKKFLLHFAKGAEYRQRLLMAGNRIGKTTAAGVELVYHLTGNYPDWWVGYRFNHPQDWYVCGKTSVKVRDTLQPLLLGKIGEFGSGLIPKALLDFETLAKVAKAETGVTEFRVKHRNGGYSTVGLRSYEQGRDAFEGTSRSIWLDEEPPIAVYGECLMRILTDTPAGEKNILYITFTPLGGTTPVIKNYLGEYDFSTATPGEAGSGKWVTGCSMYEVPHLDEKDIEEILSAYPEYQREARSKGIPQLGEGVVYPYPVEKLFIDPIEIPEHWKRCWALDFGWDEPTAILWGATDPETSTTYIYAESYLTETPVMVHADIIKGLNKAAGFTIPGVCDPSGGGKSSRDGEQARVTYRKEYGIRMKSAINSLEPGIQTVLDLMVRGRLKIFNTCIHTKAEYRNYSRDQKGRPGGADHLMDCLRYLVMSGIPIAKSLKQIRDAKIADTKTYEPQNLPQWAQWGFGIRR